MKNKEFCFSVFREGASGVLRSTDVRACAARTCATFKTYNISGISNTCHMSRIPWAFQMAKPWNPSEASNPQPKVANRKDRKKVEIDGLFKVGSSPIQKIVCLSKGEKIWLVLNFRRLWTDSKQGKGLETICYSLISRSNTLWKGKAITLNSFESQDCRNPGGNSIGGSLLAYQFYNWSTSSGRLSCTNFLTNKSIYK